MPRLLGVAQKKVKDGDMSSNETIPDKHESERRRSRGH